ncbi:4-hydroxybenzoyl-CoA thioesterase [Eikenella sp. NML080894]|uniref:acyl-CoA thioesterase n=1 Tax=Eikenella TaxID=538 RepID=UPI0007E28EEA|nr:MULTISPECIES: acyl-CoA thioesterase [Eikenella]OAM37693.1 4-hydroxybenzoyl-CoA thioesterase [Eikenella sp. NML080894]OAM44667.1 4-hydroxybenzoyl-CoA thioesterase [Eikenella sp. NML99-0057]
MAKHIYCRHHTEIEVPFFDVDVMQIVWHGHYVKYLEIARCALLDAIGYNYTVMLKHGHTWPVVKLDLKYIRPARFGQKIRVEMAVTEYESCLRIDYILRDAESGIKLTQAHTTQVAQRIDNSEMQFQTPASWQQAVRQFAGFVPLAKD